MLAILFRGSDKLYVAYRNGLLLESELKKLETCQKSRADIEPLRYAIDKTFLEKTIDSLLAAKSKHIRELATDIRMRADLIFSFPHRTDGDSTGGYHRGRRSIFLDFSQIPPNDWPVIFIHEAAHALDSIIAEGITDYGDKDLVAQFSSWLGKADTASEIDSGARASLDRWLIAGLNRGLLAETRAWTVTAVLYNEGRSEGLWQAIASYEEILAKKTDSKTMELFWFETLANKFVDPSAGIFSTDLVESELKAIRKDYFAEVRKIKLGRLSKYTQ